MTTYSGKRNPNYKHGRHCIPQFCKCGREKDYRARECAICARRGPAKDGARLVDDAKIIEAVKDNDTFLKAAKSLNASRQTICRAVERLGLDISHFRRGRGRPYTHDELFRSGHKRRLNIRSRFAELKHCEYSCLLCGNRGEWNGSLLKLEVDHINGDRGDNGLDNLRWLCPNCHSQQPTHKGLNIGRRSKYNTMNAHKKDRSAVVQTEVQYA